jgi:D-serine deaminase-like pyridoxal phosphate-dependent protein
MQLEAGGTSGLTCAKLAEAETLAASGIKDILIANQVVGYFKIQRLVNLAAYTDVMVAIDTPENAAEISQAAEARAVQVRVLVEVNIGHNRCGVEPFEPTLNLARTVTQLPGLKFMGLMGYDGHCTMRMPVEQREECSTGANQLLVQNRRYLEKAGLEVPIVSASGTFTYKYASKVPGITEIQAGTYLLMDTAFRDAGVTDFELTLSILTTVTSRQYRKGDQQIAVIDMGRKAMEPYLGMPEIKTHKGLKIVGLSQEHGKLLLESPAVDLAVGDKVEAWVRDANATINLYDQFHVIENDHVVAVWDIPARGKAT